MYITEQDFINKFELTLGDFNTDKFVAYIDRYETITLQNLFGVELFDLWEAGLTAANPIYETLRDPFTVQLECGEILNSRGIKDILLGVVYYFYTADNYTQKTINGSVKMNGENSDNVRLIKANLQSRYNEAMESYHAIQRYICENKDVYPTYKGVEKSILSIF